jgi:hypothetical protein
MGSRKRKTWSFKNELLTKSREAMLSAVQIFNNPNILFKSESFIVLAIISWTYLLHAHFKVKKIDYRYSEIINKRKMFDKTEKRANKFWDLSNCLKVIHSPIDEATKENLSFLIGIRHEIEHQMTKRIDEYLNAKFQACCLNYNHYIKDLFGNEYGIDKHLSFSIQFSSISEDHVKQLNEYSELPKNIHSFISDFENSISDDIFNNPKYSYRVFFVPKTVNNRGHADKVIEFIPANSPEAEGLNKEYTIIKDREKPKFLPNQVIEKMKSIGYKKFSMYHHTSFWKKLDAKNKNKGYGVEVAKTWYWYESWLNVVEEHCKKNEDIYK